MGARILPVRHPILSTESSEAAGDLPAFSTRLAALTAISCRLERLRFRRGSAAARRELPVARARSARRATKPGPGSSRGPASRVVGATGFEPATSSSRTKRATKLRHAPACDEARSMPLAPGADNRGFPRPKPRRRAYHAPRGAGARRGTQVQGLSRGSGKCSARCSPADCCSRSRVGLGRRPRPRRRAARARARGPSPSCRLQHVLAVVRLDPPGLRLALDPSTEPLLPRGDPARAVYERAVRDFGNDEIFVIALETERDLFERDNLLLLQRVHREIARLPGVRRVRSLFDTVSFRYVADEDWVDVGRLMDEVPEHPAELAALRAHAMGDPLLRRNLVAEDGHTAGISVRFREMSDREFIASGLDERIGATARRRDATRRPLLTSRAGPTRRRASTAGWCAISPCWFRSRCWRSQACSRSPRARDAAWCCRSPTCSIAVLWTFAAMALARPPAHDPVFDARARADRDRQRLRHPHAGGLRGGARGARRRARDHGPHARARVAADGDRGGDHARSASARCASPTCPPSSSSAPSRCSGSAA